MNQSTTKPPSVYKRGRDILAQYMQYAHFELYSGNVNFISKVMHNECKGAFTYDVSKILANFTPSPSPLSATVSIERPPYDVSICQTPPFESDIDF